MKVKVSGDVKVQGPCLIVMNHRTRFDWLFLWAYIKRVGDLTRHKIILKASLKHVPIFGEFGMPVTMQCDFLFVTAPSSQAGPCRLVSSSS